MVKDLALRWDSLDLNACSPICLLLDLFDSAYVKRIKWVYGKDLTGPRLLSLENLACEVGLWPGSASWLVNISLH